MNKIIKSGYFLVLIYLLLSGVAFGADEELADEEEPSESVTEEQVIAPTLKELPPAPTIKDVAEKQQAEEATLKKLIDAPVAGPYDEHNRSTPRSSLIALALAVKDKDYERAVNYLDLRNLPFSLEEELNGQDLVRKLVIVANRAMSIDFEDLSDDPLGHLDDSLPKYRDRVTTVKTKEGPVDILMQRVPRGDGVFVWKISNATVAIIPRLDDEFGYGIIGNRLSEIFPHYVVFGFEVWQIVMMIGLLVVGYAIAYLITFIIVKILQINERFNKERLQKFVVGPLRFLIMVIFFRATFDMIAPSLVARALFEAQTFLLIAIVWVMLGVVDVVIARFADRMMKNGQHDAVVLLRPAATGIKLIIIMIAIVSWMDNLGYEVTTILAGLGVGGVAVALAAQKSLENLIGSITIYASQPVHVGDFCKFGETLGTVQEIGLRATQLRTLGRTVVHVPNALFAAGAIENLTQRDKILYRTRLRLSYKDTPEQVRQVLAKIRELIEQHEYIDEESSRVRFIEFGEYAQELELFVYIKTMDFAEYLEQVEDVNLKISDVIESAGAHLTVPVKNINLKQPSELPAT
ncbi:MAG: mechanosensitive ion channel family protein [Gammaproteobacteria bacterium]|nr:mechanosensitive ion channel family protein [Gammaproteobacteria bacterium]NNJ50002.1 mechanosensitive ion channel family protein [Gammaproteobacteria bacterium]